VIQSHGASLRGGKLYDVASVRYNARVWMVTFSDDNADRPSRGYRGGIESHRGWEQEELVIQYDRFTHDRHPATRFLQWPTVSITGGQRGLGRLGADYWPVLRDKRGRRMGKSYQRYPESDWLLLVIPDSFLGPGPEGPVATNRMEAFREGVVEAEARIVIERALANEAGRTKLGEELAKRCEDVLYRRHMMMWLSLSDLQNKGWRWPVALAGHRWFIGSDWQQRRRELFDLAGEVEKKMK